MKKIKKKKAKKRQISAYHCDVPDCNRKIFMGWEVLGHSHQICEYHWRRHCNDNDDFDLHDALNIPKLKLGVDVDRFGFPLTEDDRAMSEQIKKQHKTEKDSKNSESIKRLKQWKDSHPERTRKRKTKTKPRPTVTDVQDELDDIANSILGA